MTTTPNIFWDKDNQFPHGTIKEFEYWNLEVSYRQHTLGSFIIFSKIPGVTSITELQNEALIELRTVMKEIELALSNSTLFQPLRINYLQLGNSLKHLHFHGIPRYAQTKTFNNRDWQDPNPNHPPVWTFTNETSDTVITIREEIQKHIR